MDEQHETPCGQAITNLCERADQLFGEIEYQQHAKTRKNKDRQCAEVNRQKIEGESPLSGKA
jgi:hypothetical protein